MNCILLGYDPFANADNYNSLLEQLLEGGQLDWNEVKELYNEGLITKEELEYAEEYLDER